MQSAPADTENNRMPSRPARLSVYQSPRNPSERQRGILTLLAEGLTQKQVAAYLGLKPRSVTSALGNMRARYTTASNEALVALAIRLQWIAVAIEVHQDAARASQADTSR